MSVCVKSSHALELILPVRGKQRSMESKKVLDLREGDIGGRRYLLCIQGDDLKNVFCY